MWWKKKEPAPLIGAFLGNYLASTRAAAESSLAALNSSVNWALTLSLALAAITVNALFIVPAFLHRELLVFLLLVASLPVMIHLGIRITKSYINVVRFAALERGVLSYLTEPDSKFNGLLAMINDHHIKWRSPIPIRTMVRKIFMEFGVAYPAIGIIGAVFYLAPYAWADRPVFCVAATAVAVVASIIEVCTFSRSAYGREVLVDPKATSLG